MSWRAFECNLPKLKARVDKRKRVPWICNKKLITPIARASRPCSLDVEGHKRDACAVAKEQRLRQHLI